MFDKKIIRRPLAGGVYRVGRCHIGRGHRVLSGLLAQVGAIYRDHDPGRDSSLEVVIGPRDLDDSRTTQQSPGLTI